ncbi:MAG: flagellar hook-basal body protein [Caldicoprobacterales bacterium]|jgi:flagellar basal-body rod protein FlgG|nr:flagellar hook-basal body complex protein [Clostridiales bacterium]
MNRILQTGRTGLDSMQRKMDAVAHNISNVQTTGYKPLKVNFADLIYDRAPVRGVPLTSEAREKPIETGTGSRVKTLMRRFEQGNLQETSNPLDLAIQGRGFFGVQDPEGNVYLTRDGAFSIDANGNLVDSQGNLLIWYSFSDEAVHFGSKENITVDERGIITISDETGQPVAAGMIALFDVTDKSMLFSVGDNYYTLEDQEALADITLINDSKILQGCLESSAVDMTKELTEMLITQRAYQINARSIHAADEMWGMVNQLRR